MKYAVKKKIACITWIVCWCAQIWSITGGGGQAFALHNYAPEKPVDLQSPQFDKFTHQTLKWLSSCLRISIPLRSDCTHVRVPLNYDNPQGRVASLFVFRLKARENSKGTVFFNPGGPGGSGTDFVLASAKKWATSSLTKNLDVVGFDPRGVGHSTPKIRCFSNQEKDQARAGAGIGNGDTDTFIQRCVQRSGTELLSHVNSVDVARDMEIIRQAMHLPRLNYVGKSYGTFIGQQYAKQFPDKVGAMIFDGVIDPALNPSELVRQQRLGFSNAVAQFAFDCAAHVPNCPLGNKNSTESDLARTFASIISQPHEHPLPTSNHRGLSMSDTRIAVHTAMYSRAMWPYLVKGLREMEHGTGDTMLKLADAYYGRSPQGEYPNLADANIAILCNDIATGVGNRVCQKWPVPFVTQAGALSVPRLHKTVVVSTTGDPATPYQAGVSLARQLGAALFTYRGNQHASTFRGVACIDEPLVKYLETNQAPASRTC